MQRKSWDAVVKYVETRTHPGQQEMPDEIQSMPEQAIVRRKVEEIEATGLCFIVFYPCVRAIGLV